LMECPICGGNCWVLWETGVRID